MSSSPSQSEQSDNIQQPDVSHQTEFSFDDDDLVQVKDESTETSLNDFFAGSAPSRERERETRQAHPESSLLADRTELPKTNSSEQVQIVHDVAEDQKTLNGDEATGQFTRTIIEARESEE